MTAVDAEEEGMSKGRMLMPAFTDQKKSGGCS